MKYKKLCGTDLDVSLICLGTMTFGEQNTQAEAFAQMDYAVEQGVNFFDTAELYAIPPKAETYGRTEEVIGNWFARRGKRQDIILATKVVGAAGHLPWIRGGKARLEKAQIRAAVEGSLKRLQTDYIDLYQIHWPQRPVNSFGKLGFDQNAVTGREADVILETLQTMRELATEGKIRHVGLSNETPWGVMTYLRLAAAHGLPRVVSIQNPYNLLNRTFDIGLAEMAMQEKVGLLAYSPLAAATLTGKYLDGKIPPRSRRAIDTRPSRYDRPGVDAVVRKYLAIAEKYALDAAQMALAYVNDRPFTTSTIIGATTMENLKVNIAAVDLALPPEVVAAIEQVHTQHPNPCP